jgi:DNA primase
MLSLRTVLPALPVAASLSANHLASLLWPGTLRRLYVAVDADRAGLTAVTTLTARALEAGIEAIALSSRLEDFNEDLRAFGKDQLADALRRQLLPEDVARFMDIAAA